MYLVGTIFKLFSKNEIKSHQTAMSEVNQHI